MIVVSLHQKAGSWCLSHKKISTRCEDASTIVPMNLNHVIYLSVLQVHASSTVIICVPPSGSQTRQRQRSHWDCPQCKNNIPYCIITVSTAVIIKYFTSSLFHQWWLTSLCLLTCQENACVIVCTGLRPLAVLPIEVQQSTV